jgi:UMF1 family MFS transporter
MMLVDVDRGRAEGTALAKKLEELSKARDQAYVEDDDSNLSQEVRDGLEESLSYQRS